MRALIGALSIATLLAIPAVTLAADNFTVTSPDFSDGGTIPMTQVFNSFGCAGGNHSPALHWSRAPAGTKSFAVTIYDPDAPTGSGWWHWTMFNIPATVTSLPADAGAEHSHTFPRGAVEGRTDFGFSRYGGPCPPVGDAPHHYQVTVYALKIAKLPLDSSASGAMVGYYLHFNTLAIARLTGLYGRLKKSKD
ncbi:MAG: YbhB/YbcL family Raf kinase inhibitor-like protein [Gammaproteobacteria bacterium]